MRIRAAWAAVAVAMLVALAACGGPRQQQTVFYEGTWECIRLTPSQTWALVSVRHPAQLPAALRRAGIRHWQMQTVGSSAAYFPATWPHDPRKQAAECERLWRSFR